MISFGLEDMEGNDVAQFTIKTCCAAEDAILKSIVNPQAEAENFDYVLILKLEPLNLMALNDDFWCRVKVV